MDKVQEIQKQTSEVGNELTTMSTEASEELGKTETAKDSISGIGGLKTSRAEALSNQLKSMAKSYGEYWDNTKTTSKNTFRKNQKSIIESRRRVEKLDGYAEKLKRKASDLPVDKGVDKLDEYEKINVDPKLEADIEAVIIDMLKDW